MTDEKLTELYNTANGLDPKRHNPITTERIFTAIRAAIEAEREACANECKKQAERQHMRFSGTFASGAESCEQAIRSRSNAAVNGRREAGDESAAGIPSA